MGRCTSLICTSRGSTTSIRATTGTAPPAESTVCARRIIAPLRMSDLAKRDSRDLVALLAHENRWYRDMALRVLGDRKDRSIIPLLRKQLAREKGQLALESLWALHACDGFADSAAQTALDTTARTFAAGACACWAITTRCRVPWSPRWLTWRNETDGEVRSQLASSAKRLPMATLAILQGLWNHDEDVRDPHIPLLCWWALEARAESHREAILQMFTDRSLWTRPMVEQFILERIMQRWAMAGGGDNLTACAKLLERAPTMKQREKLLVGLEKGFAGRSAGEIPGELRRAVTRAWSSGTGASSVTLGLRIGHAPALTQALVLIADEKAKANPRAGMHPHSRRDRPASFGAGDAEGAPRIKVHRCPPGGAGALTAIRRPEDRRSRARLCIQRICPRKAASAVRRTTCWRADRRGRWSF